jgi:hypothetical protein
MKHVKVLAIAFSIAASACTTGGLGGGDDGGGDDGGGDDGGDPPPPPPGGLTPQTFIEQLIRTECDKAFSCMAEFPASEGPFADSWGATVDECVEDDDDYIGRDMIAAAVTAGRIAWNPTLGASCLADLAFPATCSAFFLEYEYPDDCYDALAGQVADGQACSTGWECGPASECPAGTCQPYTE